MRSWAAAGSRPGVCALAALSLMACVHGRSAAPPAPAPSAAATAPQSGKPPVNADAQALASLRERVDDYVALHKKLEATLPHLPKEATPQQIDTNQRALAKLIQAARKEAKPGDVFTPESRAAIHKLMALVFGGPDGKQLRDSIMDENVLRDRALTVNSRYPDTVPLSTVPPQVLAGLPVLPEELEYRFIGHRLILMDVHAHIIIDFVDHAIPV